VARRRHRTTRFPSDLIGVDSGHRITGRRRRSGCVSVDVETTLRCTSVRGASPVNSAAPRAPTRWTRGAASARRPAGVERRARDVSDDSTHTRADPIRRPNSSLTHEACGGCELDSTKREAARRTYNRSLGFESSPLSCGCPTERGERRPIVALSNEYASGSITAKEASTVGAVAARCSAVAPPHETRPNEWAAQRGSRRHGPGRHSRRVCDVLGGPGHCRPGRHQRRSGGNPSAIPRSHSTLKCRSVYASPLRNSRTPVRSSTRSAIVDGFTTWRLMFWSPAR
jgi:hypothetical protein